MKIYTLCFSILLVAIITGCSKKTDTQPNPDPAGIGGYGITGITTGFSNITFAKNTDTTFSMPISAYVVIYGDYRPGITIAFDSMPANVVSFSPSSYSSITTAGQLYPLF